MLCVTGPHSKTVCSMSAGGTKLPDMTPEMQLQVRYFASCVQLPGCDHYVLDYALRSVVSLRLSKQH